jgi:hypothetical protein
VLPSAPLPPTFTSRTSPGVTRRSVVATAPNPPGALLGPPPLPPRPVNDARVRLGGQSATTNKNRIARIDVEDRGSSMTARATAERYVAAELDLRVRD